GGEAGRWLAGGLLRGLFWLLTLPLAFSLLWPRTAAAIARATPGATWRGIVMLWALGLHTAAWNGVKRGVRGVANLHRGSDPADPYSAAYGGAPLALRDDGIDAIAGPPMAARQALEGDEEAT